MIRQGTSHAEAHSRFVLLQEIGISSIPGWSCYATGHAMRLASTTLANKP